MTNHKVRLDQFALDIEFLLISVIQGVALAALATVAVLPIQNLQFAIWPYIGVAFLFILIFWSGAIIHALSFISWPLDLVHTFLYFLASFIEVMAIYNIASPLWWFIFLFVFQLIGAVLYLYDLSMIKKHKADFDDSPQKLALYRHILKQQYAELTQYVPASFLFNLVAIACLLYYPTLFINDGYHLFLIGLQGIFGIFFLAHVLKTYHKRSDLITNAL